MGQKILTNKPDDPISGASLMRGSTAGRKAQFVQSTNVASGSFTISSGSTVSLNNTVSLFPKDIPVSAQNVSNLATAAQSIVWPVADFYIDTQDTNHYIFRGASLSSEQLLMDLDVLNVYTPEIYSGSTTYSGEVIYFFKNNGISSHTIFYVLTFKYIMFGDANL